MYFWKVDKLTDSLIDNSLTERDKNRYSLLYLIYVSVFTSTIVSGRSSTPVLALSGIELLVILLGIIICYYQNNKGDGRDFLIRYICLSVPITIRVLVTLVMLSIVIGIVASVMDKVSLIRDSLSVTSLIYIFINGLYYYLLHKEFATITKKRTMVAT